MANIKFSDFTANATIVQADHFLVGFDDDDRNGGANPKNNKWTFAQVAAGLPTLYAGDGSINEDRVITVGYPTSDPKNTYVTTFESNKTVGSQNSQRNISGTQIQIKEVVNYLPPSYSQTRGAVLKLQHTNTAGNADTTGYINAAYVASGSSDYTTREQMGFRTNKAFVFQCTDTSWPLYFAVKGGPSNNLKTLKYSGGPGGGLFQLAAGNARTTRFTISDAGTHYRYIEALNTGKFELGRKTSSSASDEAFITMNGIGSWNGDIGVGINQSTPTATLHVTGSGTTSATKSLLVENNAGTDILNIKDSGAFTLGLGATNTAGDNSVIIGKSATDTAATNTYNTIIGASASVTGASNTANVVVGDSSLSTASGGVAIGSEAQANAVAAIAIGQRAKPTGANSITLDATGTTVTAPSTANAFGVYMTSNTTPDFKVVGGGESVLNTSFKITGQAYTEIEASVAIDSINWNNSNVQEVTLVSGATTDFDATNFKAGATYILKLIQPAGGNALVGWEAAGAVVNWSGGTPPTLSTAAAAEDIVTLICTSAAGNGTYYANATLNFS